MFLTSSIASDLQLGKQYIACAILVIYARKIVYLLVLF